MLNKNLIGAIFKVVYFLRLKQPVNIVSKDISAAFSKASARERSPAEQYL